MKHLPSEDEFSIIFEKIKPQSDPSLPKQNFVVLKDTSEKLGWSFNPMEPFNLNTGDYTIKGFETQIIVERKGALSEFALNIYEKRFEDELVRLDSFAHPYCILEFDLLDVMNFPKSTNIPKSKWQYLKTTPKIIMKKLCEFELKYKTKFIFAGRFGQEFCLSLFKRFLESHV